MALNDHFYLVIMAGGVGTRLWPKSRQATPKQFQRIIGKDTLLATTYKRVRPLLKDARHIFVSTNTQYANIVRHELPQLPKENIIIEPAGRNTAPAMAVAAYIIYARDPKAIVATAPSDHVVLKTDAFKKAIATGIQVLQKNPDTLLTVGIKPTYPETGYGYIKLGRPYTAKQYQISNIKYQKVYHVEKFVEKPDEKTAHKYVDSGKYLWNASYFMWTAEHFLALVKRFLPQVYRKLPEYKKYFATFPSMAVDTAIAEKTEKILVIPADLGWSDIGSWSAVFDIMSEDGENVISGSHIGIDTKNSLIHGADRLIATVGVEDMVVVDTGDVILVAHKDKCQDVKKVIEKLKEQGNTKFL